MTFIGPLLALLAGAVAVVEVAHDGETLTYEAPRWPLTVRFERDGAPAHVNVTRAQHEAADGYAALARAMLAEGAPGATLACAEGDRGCAIALLVHAMATERARGARALSLIHI